jgi:tellurite resistance protein TehA-like permease
MSRHERRHEKQDILGLASFGFLLVLISVIWINTPNLYRSIISFLGDFKSTKEIFPNFSLPVPEHSHPVVYTAVAQFCFVFGIFQIFILVLRLAFRESVDRIAETFSGIVFWFGAGYVSNALSGRIIGWFSFLSWIIVLIGLSLVIRSLILLFELALRKQ